MEVATMVEAPIRRVTLLEDRAQVTREGRVWLTAGSHRLRVEDVAPVLADRSLVARGGAGVRVDETRVRRRWRIGAGSRPPDAQALLEEYRRLASELTRATTLAELRAHEQQLAEEASDALLAAVNRELPFAAQFEARWTEELEAVLAEVRAAEDATLAAQGEVELVRRRLATVRVRAQSDWRIEHELAAEVVVDVTVASDGEHALTLEYMVPCALWRPIHRAALGPIAGDQASVRVTCEAAMWQATGEDWIDVELAMSTARPTQRAEPPVLSDDRLRVQKKVDKRVVVEVREQAIATTGEGGAAVASELQGVDDGGEVRLLRAATRATVRADGRLQRVPLFTFDAPAEVDRLARPERSPLVHLRSRQANLAPQPLLAGPVELVRQGAYVGTTELGFVAPGERFVLGWGGDDALRIGRRTHEEVEVGRISGKRKVTRTVELFLSNLDDAPASFRLEERVPVSEIADVQIELDAKLTKPAARPDDQGIVAWPIELPALGTQEVKLVYDLTASSDVVL